MNEFFHFVEENGVVIIILGCTLDMLIINAWSEDVGKFFALIVTNRTRFLINQRLCGYEKTNKKTED